MKPHGELYTFDLHCIDMLYSFTFGGCFNNQNYYNGSYEWDDSIVTSASDYTLSIRGVSFHSHD